MAHFVVFTLESWLFVKMFAHRKVRLPIGYNNLQLWGYYYNPLAQPMDIELGNNVGSIGETSDIIQVDKYILGVVVCTLLVAIGSEFMQSILTRGARTFDLLDILCNASGSGLGIYIAYITET
ncbi:similar to Saccharomyces cerevisiae YJR112W-A Putative protein of unknown function [Maudiozyma barnettii]|uniref:VanZ-like domain-containing protein n=1 Tax=Maudiozyma barnettii TaxID=61262 RepID=A0A8H2ZII4_9SACH|nr:hypothetical protein [Kazachstania barnettii]CAB4254988.1 similar to Saccharomyces cerevisiae YJR112W-A Putative protein of unknown function [Kazachstania barnettii]CAD1783259.1 similar to Saccharomyces cerevisiae YJR112W-A Putative protein of unknown function [Kazachstania barnettii]